MKTKILIIGSTGKLGSLLLNFSKNKKIDIFAITCFHNKKKLDKQKRHYNIPHSFCLSNSDEVKTFLIFIKKFKIKIVYFLDFGSASLAYADYFLKYNTSSVLAIANKEMIVAGGNIFIDKINKTKNKFIPLDSEHFSLINSNISNNTIDKIYITASGGPFYFDKSKDLNKVSQREVLSHPKWKMGINNLIDSSNFINKILEIYELSIIFDIDINKIDFLISQEAYVHSLVLYKDRTVSLNCFENDMMVALAYPLSLYYNFKNKTNNTNFLNLNKLRIEKFNDNRFKINKFYNIFKKLDHHQVIHFMILNNLAQKKYMDNKIKYNDIYDFIFNHIDKKSKSFKINSIKSILNYIRVLQGDN